MYYTEDEYITGEYTSDNDGWWVSLDYDGGYDFMKCDWGGHPEGCTQKRFNTVMQAFNDKYFDYPGDEVQTAFESLAEKEGWK